MIYDLSGESAGLTINWPKILTDGELLCQENKERFKKKHAEINDEYSKQTLCLFFTIRHD